MWWKTRRDHTLIPKGKSRTPMKGSISLWFTVWFSIIRFILWFTFQDYKSRSEQETPRTWNEPENQKCRGFNKREKVTSSEFFLGTVSLPSLIYIFKSWEMLRDEEPFLIRRRGHTGYFIHAAALGSFVAAWWDKLLLVWIPLRLACLRRVQPVNEDLTDDESLIPVHSYTMVHHSEPIIAASCSLKDSNNDNAANSWCGRWSIEVHE